MFYTAFCKQAGNWIEVTVPELESGQVTQARTLAEVPNTARDLIALMTDQIPEDITVLVYPWPIAFSSD